ncbi:MAG: efflux RND transporter periplasmic adaptor subunit [Nitrospinae bacterium]|nr:efflux RND transporter periplasmic adaptor subunit [Nitrospinota bacterium]
MKIKITLPILAVLAIGAVFSWVIPRTERSTVVDRSKGISVETARAPDVRKGPHGGKLFSKDDLRVEVVIFEQGVPPQFRVYIAREEGKSVPLDEVSLTIELHRLDRVDAVHFKPSGNYLLGDKTVEEPHSFDVKIQAQWKGNSYRWEYSQVEARAELSEEAMKNAGITLAAAGPAQLKNALVLPGEVGLNEEKVAHVVPRLDGVVKKVNKALGEPVHRGEIIAVLESRELADAKSDYLAALKRANLAKADIERETAVFENASKMLEVLERESDLDEIYRQLQGLTIGESRAQLLPAYTKLKLAKSVYLREKGLFEKKISSGSEYQIALEEYKSAEAKYLSLREKTAYDGSWNLLQKKRAAELAGLDLETARQKLLALGLAQPEIAALPNQTGSVFTRYELRAPIDGVVVRKHVAAGEAVRKDADIFLLADLSEVWVNIAIPAKDVKNARLGQRVRTYSENLGLEAEGTLDYLGSIVDERTRTVTGRVVVPNPEGRWRPGAFVTAELLLEENPVPLAVPAEAIQTWRDGPAAFVKYGDFFEARPLKLGKSDGEFVEVLRGLRPGERFAAKNSFTVKAEAEKASATHDH